MEVKQDSVILVRSMKKKCDKQKKKRRSVHNVLCQDNQILFYAPIQRSSETTSKVTYKFLFLKFCKTAESLIFLVTLCIGNK